jgi:hypothetical protein
MAIEGPETAVSAKDSGELSDVTVLPFDGISYLRSSQNILDLRSETSGLTQPHASAPWG